MERTRWVAVTGASNDAFLEQGWVIGFRLVTDLVLEHE